jgi:hypothetical protein
MQMPQATPIINILTYKLPFELANQMYKEFQNRFKEAKFLIDNYKTYRALSGSVSTVELFLALSIFHRRVVTNLDGAVKFYGMVTRTGETDTIKIGSYDLTGVERNRLLAVVINYQRLLEKFSVPASVMEYYETRDFLKKLISPENVFRECPKSRKKKKKKRK